MASSGKTEKLGLSLWEPGDKPERLDFRQDNQRLEELVAPHVFDVSQHLTAAEKQWVHKPFFISEYYGTGRPTRKIAYGTTTEKVTRPRFVLAYAKGDAPICIRNGTLCLYSAWGTTKYSGTPGLILENETFTICQQQDDEVTDGYRYCLNEANKRYVIIVIP